MSLLPLAVVMGERTIRQFVRFPKPDDVEGIGREMLEDLGED